MKNEERTSNIIQNVTFEKVMRSGRRGKGYAVYVSAGIAGVRKSIELDSRDSFIPEAGTAYSVQICDEKKPEDFLSGKYLVRIIEEYVAVEVVDESPVSESQDMIVKMLYGETCKTKRKTRFPRLSSTQNIEHFLTQMSSFHEQTREVLGDVCNEQTFASFVNFIGSHAMIDRSTQPPQQITFENNPQKIVMRALDWHYLSKMDNAEHVGALVSLLAACDITNEEGTEMIYDFSKNRRKLIA